VSRSAGDDLIVYTLYDWDSKDLVG